MLLYCVLKNMWDRLSSRSGALLAQRDRLESRSHKLIRPTLRCSAKNLEQTQALCAKLRSHVRQSAPLLCCAGRYVYPLIKHLLGNTVQSMIMMPFDARELRQKLDELDLGF